MKLENIYEILKNSTAEDFYTPNKTNSQFIYINDVNLVIEENQEKEDSDVFDFDYFHDINKNQIATLSLVDQLVYDIIQIKNFPETYNKTKISQFEVKYAGVTIYDLQYIMIKNLSSLHIMIPSVPTPYDYEYNFCDIYNNKHSPNIYSVKLDTRVTIKQSSFSDFIR